MKLMFTKIFVSLLLIVGFTAQVAQAQNIIWGGPGDPNGTFDGGLNDWTAVAVSCENRPNGQSVPGDSAVWRWASGADVRSRGAYFGARTALMSPSVANGAVVFDSDFLDNNGVAGNFGLGACPSPQRAELISPIIDMSGASSAAVSFFQYYRRFGGPDGGQTAVATYIEVSTDGGATWSAPITVNNTVSVNGETPNGNRGLVDITALAAGKSNVRFKFVWHGDYYFWMIDDVAVVTLPDNNLALTRHYYPPTSIFTPKSFADIDTFTFYARVSNLGGNAVDAYLKASITNPNNTETFWSDSVLINIPTGVANRVDSLPLSSFFVPNVLEPGEYRIRYELFQPGVTDFEPSDNVRQSAFVITNDNFWQSGVQRGHVRPCFEATCTELQPWGFGALFGTSANTQERFKVNVVECNLAGETAAADLNGKQSSIFLLEILGDGFFGSDIQLGDGTTNDFRAFGDANLAAANHQQILTVALEDANSGDAGFILENGATYFPFVTVDAGVRIGYDNAFNNFPTGLGDNNVLLKSRIFFGGTFRATFRDAMPFIRLPLELVTSVDNNPLPETAVALLPNPASSVSQVRIDLEKASNITITLADLSGRVINYENFSNVTQMTHDLNVSQLAAGTYLVRVASEYGTKTQKLVVVK